MNRKIFFGVGGTIIIIGFYLLLNGISLMIKNITSIPITEVASIRVLVGLPFIMIGCVIFVFGYPKAIVT